MRSLSEMDRIATQRMGQGEPQNRMYPSEMDRIAEQRFAMQSNQGQQSQPDRSFMRSLSEILNKGVNYAGAQASKSPGLSKFLNKSAELLGPMERGFKQSGLPEAAGGTLQSLLSTGASIGNIPVSLAELFSGKDLEKYKIEHPNLSQYFEDPGAAFTGGEFFGNLLPIVKGVNALQSIGRPAGKLGLLSDVAKGAATGWALGESPEGDRGISTIMSGIFGGARSLNPSVIASRLTNQVKKLGGQFNKRYDNIFKEATDTGISNVGKPKINFSNIKRNTKAADHHSLLEFEKNPTLQNAHSAQSDLGKIIREFSGKPSSKLSTDQLAMLKNAESARTNIQDSIANAFKKKGRNDLAKEYVSTTADYAKELAPYTESRHLAEYLARAKKGKNVSSSDLIKALKKDKNFTQDLGHMYPELAISSMMPNIFKGLGVSTGALSSGALAKHAYNRLLENED